MSAQRLRDLVGGRWDGGGREIHGLVETEHGWVKVELLHVGTQWAATAFLGGLAVASDRGTDAVELVRNLLRQLER